jgi:hypothetical protein
MQFTAGLTGDAATLAREHKEVLEHLPATIRAFILSELQKWLVLFRPEQRYQRALLEHLSRLSRPELQEMVAGIARVEATASLNRGAGGDPARFQDEAQALLRKRRLVPAWRREIDAFFRRVDSALETQLYPGAAPRRLVVQLYGSGIAVQTAKLWSRFKGIGVRIPLKLEREGSNSFLPELFGRRETPAPGAALFAAVGETAGHDPTDAWIIEADEAAHHLCVDVTAGRTSEAPITGLSYARLRGYRDELTRALYRKIQSGVESPQAFAAYARGLKIAPDPGALPSSTDAVHAFVRDVFLTGNGTLFVNNTFVEWAAVQALRRAQPRILMTRFGVRDKLKPFSSLLLFSQPRTSDQIPIIEDPVGSFIDVEQLSYYIWLNAEKSPAYRNKTLYLFLAEGIDEMLAIRSDVALAEPPAPPASLSDVCATMAQWLGVQLPEISGRPIPRLVS